MQRTFKVKQFLFQNFAFQRSLITPVTNIKCKTGFVENFFLLPTLSQNFEIDKVKCMAKSEKNSIFYLKF